ncbi:prolipoprotein diacylglyceryl transferase [Mycobacteriaceae bacterium 1482268.1]|nr:prolipoprotein diacylglyceryl transferase [Mycobacteriaceae bacterium 1482268.1]
MTTTLLASFPSPSQGVWHLGPIPIRAYALFILVGVIAALIIGNRRWTQRGGEPGVIYDIALWAIIFGLIGGRLYHVLTDWSTYFGPGGAGLMAAFKIQEGGLGIWGAVTLGGVGAWIGCRRRGIPLPPFGDAIAPGIVLAQAIGRIGNYFNQELYGRATTMPWGLEIFERRDSHGALDSLNGVSTGQLIEIVHPTFLYELLWNLLVFIFLIWVDRRYRIGHGRLFALYVAAYCFGRFWVELMRSDMATHIAGIRINSFVSVFVFIGAVVYIMVAPKGREDPSELRGDALVDEKQSPVEEVTKELAAVAATTGVVAAAKAAGEMEDEDAAESEGAAETEAGPTSDQEAEPVSEAEQLTADVETAPAEDIAEAEAFAEAGEKAQAEAEADEVSQEPEPVAEAEQLTADVETAPAEDIAEAESFAEVGEEPEESEPGAEAVGGVGAVEGDEVAEAEEAAPEVHEAAVESAEEAAATAEDVSEEAAGDVSEEGEADAAEHEEPADEAPADSQNKPESEAAGDDVPEPKPEADQVAEPEAATPDVHEAAARDTETAGDERRGIGKRIRRRFGFRRG